MRSVTRQFDRPRRRITPSADPPYELFGQFFECDLLASLASTSYRDGSCISKAVQLITVQLPGLRPLDKLHLPRALSAGRLANLEGFFLLAPASDPPQRSCPSAIPGRARCDQVRMPAANRNYRWSGEDKDSGTCAPHPTSP